VPDSVFKIAALQRLYIGGNFIRALPETISSLKSLRELVAPDNYIVELPQSLILLTALERLTLSNNRIRIVPSVYGRITSLTALELIGNPLDSPPLSLYAPLNVLLVVGGARDCNSLLFVATGTPAPLRTPSVSFLTICCGLKKPELQIGWISPAFTWTPMQRFVASAIDTRCNALTIQFVRVALFPALSDTSAQ